MATKFTMLFGLTTKNAAGANARSGGWSESFYTALTVGSAALAAAMTRLQNTRAALLPDSASIVGQRQANVNPTSGSISTDVSFPGRVGINCGLPSMALQFTMRSTTGFNERNIELRGTPDPWIQTGEYKSTAESSGGLRNFFNELTTSGWQGKFVDRTQARTALVSLSELGVALCEDVHGLDVNDVVDLQSIIDDAGGKSSILATVKTIVSDVSVGLELPYKFRGFVYKGGHIRRHVERFDTLVIDPAEIASPTAVSRKAGRPFKQFRGRRTAKR